MNKSNVIPTDEYKAALKLQEWVTWLENNRHHFTAILARGEGAPMHTTVTHELACIMTELARWLRRMK